VENSEFHHNYFGLYTFGATGMVFRNNEMYENVQYGLDPHDDSNNFIVEYNDVYSNGNHGIIFSKRCFNNVIRYNHSHDNRLHGVMLDRNSNDNSVYGNVLTGNTDGIALWDSHQNAIYDNKILDSKRGIRLNNQSSNNDITTNQIADSTQYGLYLYDNAAENWFWNNRMDGNVVGVYIKSSDNHIYDNWISESREGVYLTSEAENNTIWKNRIANNEFGIYLKTAPDDLLLQNVFMSNDVNIRIDRDEWIVPRDDIIVLDDKIKERASTVLALLGR
jgi:parallel beta-helix repeat protein